MMVAEYDYFDVRPNFECQTILKTQEHYVLALEKDTASTERLSFNSSTCDSFL